MQYIKLAIIALTKKLLVKITMLNSFTYTASLITTCEIALFFFYLQMKIQKLDSLIRVRNAENKNPRGWVQVHFAI